MQLNQVTIAVADIDRSVNFYQQLGLELIVRNDHYCRFVVPGNGATFSIHLGERPTPGSTVIYFEHEGLDEWVRLLREKRLAFLQEPTDQSWLWREARLTDPDGHELCLYYAGENRLDPPWRLPHS